MKPCLRAPGSATKRPNVIGWDGGPPTVGARYLKLVEDLSTARGELTDVRRERRKAEMTGDLDVSLIDAEAALERIVRELRAEMRRLEKVGKS